MTTHAVRIDGQTPRELRPETVEADEEWTVVRRPMRYECASGDWIEGEWTGVPVFELIEAAGVPDDTTHVQLESADGYRACVPLLDLEGAIVAIDGMGYREETGEPDAGDGDFPRFIAPRILGPRTIKELARIRPLSLAPGEDREDYEDLPTD